MKIRCALRRGTTALLETDGILEKWPLQIRNRAVECMSFSDVDQVKFYISGKVLVDFRQPTG